MTASPGAWPLWGRRRAGGREPGQQDVAVGVGEPINAAYVLRAQDEEGRMAVFLNGGSA
jgi:hypothetical protein